MQRLACDLATGRQHLFERHLGLVAAAVRSCRPRPARRRCRPTCRPQSCVRSAQHDHHAAGHVFATMIADALDHREAPELRTAKRSPATPAKYASPSVAPYITVLPTMMFSLRGAPEIGAWLDDDATARQTLADVVVAFARQLEGHALGQERAETLAGGAAQPDADGVVRQAGVAVATWQPHPTAWCRTVRLTLMILVSISTF